MAILAARLDGWDCATLVQSDVTGDVFIVSTVDNLYACETLVFPGAFERIRDAVTGRRAVVASWTEVWGRRGDRHEEGIVWALTH